MDSASGLSIIGLVDETGNAHFIRADNAQYVGQFSTSGSSIYMTVEGYAEVGKTFADGSNHSSGTISGTLQERQSISATIQFTTDAGTSTEGTLHLTFDPLYNKHSSLATVSGTYLDLQHRVEIDPGGVIGQVTPFCHSTGQVSVINTNHNLYEVQLAISCDGKAFSTASGLATLDDTVTPERLLIGLLGNNGTGVSIWTRCILPESCPLTIQ